jgi:transcriptional regulator with XRE-family HTH domain
MTIETTPLTSDQLGFWARCLRTTQHLSLEALAESSGLSTRTIQRVEAGEASTITTRRCLARGLGYDNHDIFDDPEFGQNVRQFLDVTGKAAVREHFPDHVPLVASPVASGGALGRLIDASEAYIFNCDESLSREAQELAASLFDLVKDYNDVWNDLTHSDRLRAATDFDDAMQAFGRLQVRAYTATRSTAILGKSWPDQTPLPLRIGYLAVIDANREIAHLMVPNSLGSPFA